ncbi:porin [Vibrio mimicus]
MKKTILATSLVSLLPLSAAAAQVDIPMPEIYGDIRAQAAWHENSDYTTDIYQAELGAVGNVKVNNFGIGYQLEAEYSESMTDKSEDNDLIVREANIKVLFPSLGGAYIGSGTTGTWTDLYSKVDIFESNNMERHSNNMLFGAQRYSTNQIAVMTPVFGGFQFKAAVVSPDEHNGTDADIIGLRALYTQDAFSLVVNHGWTSKEMLGGAKEDGQRTLVASSYQFDQFYVGAVAEFDYNMPFDSRNVYAVSAKYTLNSTSFSLGYQYADWKGSRDNESLYLANVRHDFNEHFAVFAEGALYGESYKAGVSKPADIAKGDNVNIGLIVSF